MKKNADLKDKRARLPESFRGYFWDCDFSLLNMDAYRDFILGRLLQYGGRDAMVWVLRHFNRNEVAAFLKTRRGALMDRKSYLFWTKLASSGSLWE